MAAVLPMAETEIGGLEAAFQAHHDHLFGLSYRMTGSIEDAEEVVQETFERAVERPPARTDEPWRPWLAHVAVNLSIDRLRRRRRRRAAADLWLPAPLITSDGRGSAGRVGSASGADATAVASSVGESPEARYELLESVTFAFLLAVEALTPQQRAALILRDVFDYSAGEVAALLGTSPGNIRVVLHRARTVMRSYDGAPCRPDEYLEERTRQVLESFMRCLAEQDVEGLAELLAEDVRTVTDPDGTYTALTRPLSGRHAVSQLYLSVAKRRMKVADFDICAANGLPVLVVEFAESERHQAPCALIHCELDSDGLIRELDTVLGPRKLSDVLGKTAR